MYFQKLTPLLLVVLLAGCASFTASGRPGYQGADLVNSADTADVVGTWNVRDLNPPANAQSQRTIIQYHSDGTVQGDVSIDDDGFGSISFRLTGNWVLQDDVLTHSNLIMTSLDDSEFGSLLGKMINSASHDLGGSASIYELSEKRMVLVGTDGAAMEYTRQPGSFTKGH